MWLILYVRGEKIMLSHIDRLFELCKEQPFSEEKITKYILDNKMSSEEVTRSALKLCNYGFCSYSDYLYEKEKEPMPEDLITFNWETLFNILIKNGLDANLVICDDGMNYENILQEIKYFDDGNLGAKILRNTLNHNGNPNIVIDNQNLFEEIDSDLMLDISMGLYHHKWQLDNAWRFWLVMVGFGGTINNVQCPVEMRDGFQVEIFKEFEKFDYNIKWFEKDFEMQIFDKETKTVVAIA